MIPVFDIHRQNKNIRTEINNAISGVIDGGVYILGPHVQKFEAEFAQFIGVKYAVGVASGTDAITLALLALGLQAGDEVILPANSYPSVFALSSAGFIPKLVDVDVQTLLIDTEKIESAISKKTRAIVPVHLYGQAVNMEKIQKIGKAYKIPVVEDCAQAHGAGIKNSQESGWKKVGSIGDLGCFSFYPTKNLGCFGDGGMVVTNNEHLYTTVKLLRMYGEKGRYESILPGRNSRLDEIQAAILSVKLKHLDAWNQKREKLADLYSTLLSNEKNISLPITNTYGKNVHHLYVIRTKKRSKMKEYLENHGVQTGIHYPVPIHLVPSYSFLKCKQGDFPVSEQAAHEVLSLPLYPELHEEEVERISSEIKKALS